MHQGAVFLDRQARDLSSGNPAAGLGGWTHRRRAHLVARQPELQEDDRAAGKDEVEKGFSAVKLALGTSPAPFFRFPQLEHNPSTMAYLGTRNIAMFSCD